MTKEKTTFREMIEKLKEFQISFNSTYNTEPTHLNFKDYFLRYKLMKEENEEYLEACEHNDMVEIADALGDQLVVLLGTIVSHGLHYVIEDVFDEIMRSNMSKLDENGQPIINGVNGVWDETRPEGKVLKSKNYFEPNLKQFIDGE